MADEQEVGVIFPLAGLNTTCEFGRQPIDTTASAANVRAYETIRERAAGGSRAGLTQYIPQEVVGDFEVQHLNILVDPQSPALNTEAEDTAGVLDPATNNHSQRNPTGRRVRRGGSGRQQNRNRPRRGATADIEFVQKYRVQPGNISSVYALTLPTPPGVNNLLVVIVRTEKAGTGSELVESVKNAILDDFTQVGLAGYESEVTINLGGGNSTDSLSVWYRTANAGVNDQTVRVFPGASGIYEIVVLEYRYADATEPVSDKVRGADATPAASWALGPLPLNDTAGQLVVAAYTNFNTVVSIASSGYKARFGISGDPNSDSANMAVIERSGLSGVGPENPTVADTLVPRGFAGIAIAITK